MSLLTVNQLEKTYNHIHIIEDVSFQVNQGEIYGILGTNGAGKSTLLRMVAGLLKPDNGTIQLSKRLQGNDKAIGYVSDTPHLYPYLTGYEYLSFIYELWNLCPDKKTDTINRYLSLLQLTNKADSLITTYSKGTKQKLSMAAALLPQPTLLILDEPLTGFDPLSTHWAKSFLRAFAKKENAVLLTTHMLDIAYFLCDRIGIIQDGKLSLEVTTSHTYDDFKKQILKSM